MKLYLVTQNVMNGYDTYDAAVVAAHTPAAAKAMHPQGVPDEKVQAELIGTAKRGQKQELILASFNAG